MGRPAAGRGATALARSLPFHGRRPRTRCHVSVVFTRAGLADGARSALPLAAGAGVFAMALGVLASGKGMSALEIGLMSALVFAGASQVVAVELWASPLPLSALLLATLAINSRHLLMGATLGPWLRPLGAAPALACCFFLVDESWALSLIRVREGSRDAAFLPGAGLCLYAFWVTGTLLGHAAGAQVPDPARLGLDFLGVAVFLSLLTLFRPGRREALPFAVTAGCTLALGHVLPGKWHVLLGALAGAALVAVLPARSPRVPAP